MSNQQCDVCGHTEEHAMMNTVKLYDTGVSEEIEDVFDARDQVNDMRQELERYKEAISFYEQHSATALVTTVNSCLLHREDVE